MNITIRPHTDDDYPLLAELSTASMPDYPKAPDNIAHGDRVRDPKCYHNRLIAMCDGAPAGYVSFGNIEWMYHPQRFAVYVHVRPERRNRGIGTALYDAALCELAPKDPSVLRSFAREDMPGSVHFLSKRGFHEEERNWESRLDVASFDPSPYAGIDDCMREIGVELTTFAALAADRDRDRKMHEAETLLVRDLPSPEPLTPLDYEQYRKQLLEHPCLLPEGWVVATHNGEYIGMSVVWDDPGHDWLDTGLTAVRREWRRKRIALAMKLKVIEYARRRGVREIRTDNESNNRGMLGINERLGFVKQPVWIGFAKKI